MKLMIWPLAAIGFVAALSALYGAVMIIAAKRQEELDQGKWIFYLGGSFFWAAFAVGAIIQIDYPMAVFSGLLGVVLARLWWRIHKARLSLGKVIPLRHWWIKVW